MELPQFCGLSLRRFPFVSNQEKVQTQTDPTLAVELSLADLYQYKLSSPEKALIHLRKALLLQDDVDVQARVAELEKIVTQKSL